MGGPTALQGDVSLAELRADVMAVTWASSMAALSAASLVGATGEVKVELTAVATAAWWVESTVGEQVVTMAAVMAEKMAENLTGKTASTMALS